MKKDTPDVSNPCFSSWVVDLSVFRIFDILIVYHRPHHYHISHIEIFFSFAIEIYQSTCPSLSWIIHIHTIAEHIHCSIHIHTCPCSSVVYFMLQKPVNIRLRSISSSVVSPLSHIRSICTTSRVKSVLIELYFPFLEPR